MVKDLCSKWKAKKRERYLCNIRLGRFSASATLYLRLDHVTYSFSVDLFHKSDTTLDGNSGSHGRDRLPRQPQYRLQTIIRHW